MNTSTAVELQPQLNPQRKWLNRTVIAIIFATFFSDVSHEMCTAVLPMYLVTIGLGPAALGWIEGIADFLVSIAKLGGGYLGHHVERKRPWASLGYLVTTLATWGIAFVGSLLALVSLRGAAWLGRGFRSPLRDFMLADAVEPKYFGRAYGLERAGDMLGAVVGPLLAFLLLWIGVEFRVIILWTLLPGLLAAGAFFFFTRDRITTSSTSFVSVSPPTPARFPKIFWLFLIGVFIFGLGDFSRTFLIWLVAKNQGENGQVAVGTLSWAVVLYMIHNLVSAAAAYPVGHLGDRRRKLPILTFGYGLGVFTNFMLAFLSGQIVWLGMAIVFSGIYIAVEETLEKAVAAEILPRDRRSLGLGILACGNAIGDMVSSLYVGLLLEAGYPTLAFGIAAGVGAMGVLWMIWVIRKGSLFPNPNSTISNSN